MVPDDAVVMTVSDNGIGITAAALSRVFEPFVQDAHAVGFNGGGLGIGLALVRELVEGHGGSVVATSAGARLGSQFVVTLPMAGADANRPPAGSSNCVQNLDLPVARARRRFETLAVEDPDLAALAADQATRPQGARCHGD